MAAAPLLDSKQRVEQLQRLKQIQQQQQQDNGIKPAAGAARSPAAAAGAGAGGGADAIASTLAALLRRGLQPAPEYTCEGSVHWSLQQYRQAVQQAEEAAAVAAAAASAAAKKRSATAAGLDGGGGSSKRFAMSDFNFVGSVAGEQLWYLPGTASEAEQVRALGRVYCQRQGHLAGCTACTCRASGCCYQ